MYIVKVVVTCTKTIEVEENTKLSVTLAQQQHQHNAVTTTCQNLFYITSAINVYMNIKFAQLRKFEKSYEQMNSRGI